jgi:hypothetical protein
VIRSIAIAVGMTLAACGQSAPRTNPIEHVPVVAAVDAAVVEETPAAQESEWTRVGPCTAADAELRTEEIRAIEERLDQPDADPKLALDELRAVLQRPCLTQLKLAYGLPKQASLQRVKQVFDQGLATALVEVAAGIHRNSTGERLQTLPPELVPELDDKQRAAIAPLRCIATDGSCALAQSYIRRAEAAFDNRFSTKNMRAELCAHDPSSDAERAPRYDEWIGCVSSRGQRNHRFAETALRVPKTGWLVVRGRRGHHQYSDELRAYDLATGAAYVATNSGARFGPARQPLGPASYAGRVDPAHVRELAFMLLARDAIVPVRTDQVSAVLPADVSLELSPDGAADVIHYGPLSMYSSAETLIGFRYVDGKLSKSGDLHWPSAYDDVDAHIVELVQVMEAGLARGCVPSKLPRPETLEGPGGMLSFEATLDTENASAVALERALYGLRAPACKR